MEKMELKGIIHKYQTACIIVLGDRVNIRRVIAMFSLLNLLPVQNRFSFKSTFFYFYF